jgi:hypothetical protein
MSGVGIPAWFCGIVSIAAGVLYVFWGLGRLIVPILLCRAAVFLVLFLFFWCIGFSRGVVCLLWLVPGAVVLVLGVVYCIHSLSTFMYFLVIKF